MMIIDLWQNNVIVLLSNIKETKKLYKQFVTKKLIDQSKMKYGFKGDHQPMTDVIWLCSISNREARNEHTSHLCDQIYWVCRD